MNRATSTIAAASFVLALLPGALLGQTEPTPAVGAAPAPTRVEVVPRQGLPGRDVALLVSGQQGGQIAVSALVFPTASAGNPSRVPWVLDVPGFTLVSMAEGDSVDLEVAVYALRKGGEIIGHQEVTLHINALPTAWKTDGGLKLLGYVDTSQPPAVLRFLVRDPSSEAFGNWEMPVPARAGQSIRNVDFGFAVVTDAQGGAGGMVGTGFEGMTGRSALLAMVAPEPAGSWVVVGVGGAGSSATAPPFSLAGAGNLPATRPVVRPGAVVRVAVLGEGLPGNLEALARVVRGDGRPDVGCSARIMSRLPAPAGPFERVDVAVTLPAAVPPGEHALVVSLRPAGGVEAGSVARSFRIPPPGLTAASPAWPAVPIDESGKIMVATGTNVGTRPSEEEAPPHLKDAYREAVTRYAADGSADSLRALVEFERASLGGGSSSELGRLGSAERSVARSLAKGSPQTLVGLSLVHLDLYREHSRDQAYLAIGHSRRIVEELAEMVASEVKDKEGKRTAADVLTVFGASLQSVGSYVSAERLFVRAAALDEDDVAALMGRASILERLGDFPHTTEVLEKVLALRPDHAEAKLRLGVNLRRTGRDSGARAALTACTAADRPGWVRSVAWQELASMLIADDHMSDATNMLREAVAALPADSQLQVLLAATLDRTRHHREALAVVGSVVDHPAGDTPSARLLYSQQPHGDLDATQRRLDAARTQALAALAAAGKEQRP